MDTSRLDYLKKRRAKELHNVKNQIRPSSVAGQKKVTDEEILYAFDQLKRGKRERWKKRFGPDAPTPFVGCRREEIQKAVKFYYEVEYSDSGFRNRLKKLVEQGSITKFRMDTYLVYYE